jgi:NADPH-dependent ferric siderophore reductase
MATHQITRVRRETRRRMLTVASADLLTPRMLRIGFTAEDFADFDSAAYDDHVKLFFPDAARGEDDKPVMRDFTPRAFDLAQGTLTIDFALHDSGPATAWATTAQVGDRLEIGGPRGSMIVPDDFDWYLLIGDETALPAIGRRLQELRPGVPVATIAAVEDAGEIQAFTTKAAWTATWILREAAGADDARSLGEALSSHAFPPGDGFVWIAAEAAVARALRNAIVDRGHPKSWIKAAGYWQRGEADAHVRIDD